jgi:hypothetical protein
MKFVAGEFGLIRKKVFRCKEKANCQKSAISLPSPAVIATKK